ncbi:hypothetical protein D3C80_1187220 [compost metagenome]
MHGRVDCIPDAGVQGIGGLRELLFEQVGPHDEVAAVPEVAAVYVSTRRALGRLFHEGGDGAEAGGRGCDIAVSRRGRVGHDAQGHDAVSQRSFNSLGHSFMEGVVIRHVVIGRDEQVDRVGRLSSRPDRRGRHSRGRIASLGLQQDNG